jgi:hypothetical protein
VQQLELRHLQFAYNRDIFIAHLSHPQF